MSARNLLRKVPPPVGVIFFALLGLALIIGSRMATVDQVSAEVDFDERARLTLPARRDAGEPKIVTADFDGPVARLAERMRETSALALVLGYARVNEAIEKRPAPADVDALLALVSRAGLMPPGVSMPEPFASGVVVSRRANIYVRYRVAPFGVELVSIGHTKEDGPPILIRLPGDAPERGRLAAAAPAKEDSGVSLYTSSATDAVTIPPPFSTPGTMLKAGWEPDKFRSLDITQEQMAQLNEWVKTVRK